MGREHLRNITAIPGGEVVAVADPHEASIDQALRVTPDARVFAAVEELMAHVEVGMDLPPGFLHVVYEVDDHEAHVAMLRQAGVRFLIEPQEIDTVVGRRKIAFFEAPDGIRTEVMQILEDREEAVNSG